MFENLFRKPGPNQKLIFIVEDNEAYANSLRSYIKTHFPKIKEIKIFGIGEMCLTELHRDPGIIIMDYTLNTDFKPAYNGAEVIERIKASKPQTNIIVLSSHENSGDISKVIREYNCNYVQKDKEAFGRVELLIKNILTQKASSAFQPAP